MARRYDSDAIEADLKRIREHQRELQRRLQGMSGSLEEQEQRPALSVLDGAGMTTKRNVKLRLV